MANTGTNDLNLNSNALIARPLRKLELSKETNKMGQRE